MQKSKPFYNNHSGMIQTQVELAKSGIFTRQMKDVAAAEHMPPDVLIGRVARGSIAIMTRGEVSVGIGEGLRTKVNVNLGTSSVLCNPSEEVKKGSYCRKTWCGYHQRAFHGWKYHGHKKRNFQKLLPSYHHRSHLPGLCRTGYKKNDLGPYS